MKNISKSFISGNVGIFLNLYSFSLNIVFVEMLSPVELMPGIFTDRLPINIFI